MGKLAVYRHAEDDVCMLITFELELYFMKELALALLFPARQPVPSSSKRSSFLRML